MLYAASVHYSVALCLCSGAEVLPHLLDISCTAVEGGLIQVLSCVLAISP